ncbi:hypothetical protein M3649_03915 [Ureibacillus chungkukjangi]|uniref:hypothetical protein n=1 Tax=Ureibacillus chungkukjangi TaxID=1202712 RepID=UPI00203A65A7|nr:hypothetical protein [Ureibacillus chungkukjangi]MCM3387278.1 hypothetical protein [Ureibacillus chungkukjangi]
MKNKGDNKYVQKPNFWGEFEANIPINVKEFVYEQYNEVETLYVYCDGSLKRGDSRASVGVSYIGNASVYSKGKLVYLERSITSMNVAAELYAIIFGLDNFEKYITPNTKNILIYSDLRDIENVLLDDFQYQRDEINKIREEMINKIKNHKSKLPIEIKYLERFYRYGNPFYKSAHNTASKLLKQ